MDEEVHILAREIAATLTDVDRKQLRFNDIVQKAKLFYPTDVKNGVKELVQSCDKTSELYVRKVPMWASLNADYRWMLV